MTKYKLFNRALSVMMIGIALYPHSQEAQAHVSDVFLMINPMPERLITGKVITQEDRVPLIGVSVVIKGSSGGTVTDANGDFSLNIPDNETTLVFSYLGYTTKEVTVKEERTLNVVLAQNNQELSQIVVIGYGTTKKSDLTGSVSSIKSEELKAVPVTSFEQALQGRAAGGAGYTNNGCTWWRNQHQNQGNQFC